MKKTILLVSLTLLSWVTFAQHNDNTSNENSQSMAATFENKNLDKAYTQYIQLKDALVASRSDEVQQAASQLEKSLTSVENGKKAQDEASKIVAAASLDEQRKAFSTLSDEMTKLVKKSTISTGEIYLKYCPMANGNKGGYWLSNEKEIKNPYFGAKMLKCGSVKETI